MNKPKRVFLAGLSALVVGTAAELIATGAWGRPLDPQKKLPPPPTPSDTFGDPPPQNAPAAPFPGPNLDPRVDPKQMLQHNDSQIHENVEKLYFLAAELKAEVEKTDSQNVLSLVMVQKCEQIEKFAKQIRNLAKG
jgi:hypothetical protein